MFSRKFLIICSIALLLVVIATSANARKAPKGSSAVAKKILKSAFKWAAKHCLEQAANNCKQHWKHPKALIDCARGFLQANKGRCVAG